MTLRIGFNVRELASPHMRGLARYTTSLLAAFSKDPTLELHLFSDQAPAPEHLHGVRGEVHIVRSSRETLWEAWALPRKLALCGVDLFHAPCDRGLPLVKPCPCV